MIFRKDNRGDSFQRQISNLRKQLQTDDEGGDEQYNDEYRYGDPQDTGQFDTGSTSNAPREETYAPAHTGTEQRGAMPAQQPAPPVAVPSSHRPSWQSTDAATSVIAANAHWNGVLKSEGSLHVHGRADGELHAADDVYVAEGAEVDAELFADNVVVAGVVRGRVEARGRLEVLPQGHVAGDVQAPKLVVHEGARISGQLKMESAGQPAAATYSTGGKSSKQRRSGK